QLARGLATKGFISQIERNRTTPSLPKLRVMAERLGLPLGHFTGDRSPHELTYLRKSAELAVKAHEPERALHLVDEGLRLPGTADERAELLRVQGLAFDALGRLADAVGSLQIAAATAPPDDPELSGATSRALSNTATAHWSSIPGSANSVPPTESSTTWAMCTTPPDEGVRRPNFSSAVLTEPARSTMISRSAWPPAHWPVTTSRVASS